MGIQPIPYQNGYATTGDTMARRYGVFTNGAPMPVYTNDTYATNGRITDVGSGFRANRFMLGIKSLFVFFGAIGSLIGNAAKAFSWTNPYVAAVGVGAPLVGTAGSALVDTGMNLTGLNVYSTPEPKPSWQSRYSPFGR